MHIEEHTLDETKQLIEGCIKGDRHSQGRLYERYMQPMFAVCMRYAKNREEAEEILQEGFIRVFDYLHQFRFDGSFEGWMRKIMVNCALQKYRNKGHLRPLLSDDVAELENIGHEDIIAQIGAKELLKMVQQLPPAYRLVFNLYVFEGLKHREIAAQLNISEGTSKSNLSDARNLLQKAVTNSLQTAKQKTM